MKLLRNILLVLLVVIVILVAAGFIVYNSWTRGPLPQHDGELTVEGLTDTVTVYRDEWGVPHIYASSSYDLFFAQGYTQAQDRWWQMEFFRHSGNGTIQELTGKNDSLMETDVFIRTVGWRRAAERDLENADPELVICLQAFADGVNAYIHSRPASALALEYNVLGVTGVSIEIEDWTPADTLVWAKVMAWSLSGNQGVEQFRSDLLDNFGDEMVEDYAPAYPFGEKPTILFPEDLPLTEDSLHAPNMTDTAGIRGVSTQLAGNFSPDAGLIFGSGDGIGSNNWVVDGDHTETGMPLLANDPHLGMQMPSIWYEVGLHCEPVSEECPFNVTGFAFSPAPAVIIGHNDNIAWGVTNVGWDTQDLYMITVNPENDLQYDWNGEWRDMEVIEETINFGNGADPITIQVRETHLGPIINDNEIDDDGNILGFNNENPMALRWTAISETGTIFESIIKLNVASNWQEFREAVSLWDSPSQNIIYADIEGNIGYQTPGNIPIRAEGHTGTMPVDGSTDEYEWLGYVPAENLPRIFNPARGFVATANQALVPLEYYEQLAAELGDEYGENANYVFDQYWSYGYRGQRIVEMLEATDEHSFETFQAIQGDNKMTIAEELAPYLETLDFGDSDLNDLRDWMLDWDYQMHMDNPQAALFASFWAELMDNLYEDQLGDVGSAGGGSENMWATLQLADDPENEWWDDANTDDVVETRDDILLLSFREGYDALVDELGDNRDDWSWGELHTTTFVSNPLGVSGIGLIENMVNRGPAATSGGSAIVNAASWSASSGDFEVGSGVSMRMLIDLSDLSNSLTMHTTGQSGHPFSDHYGDMIDSWRNIEYHPMLWTREQVEDAAVSTLTMNPE